MMFQHTAARRRLRQPRGCVSLPSKVSTHSRAEAAAHSVPSLPNPITVSTHSRAEAAATKEIPKRVDTNVSTHSRAEAAANL